MLKSTEDFFAGVVTWLTLEEDRRLCKVVLEEYLVAVELTR